MATILAAITFTSFKERFFAPKLYPQLEAYFKTLNAKQFNKTHFEALANIKHNISTSSFDFGNSNLIFYCSENTMRSQAAQVFAHTLCYVNRYKKVKVFSAGLSSGEVNPKMIAHLTKIGYKVSNEEKDGKNIYSVKFSEMAPPIILFSKIVSDKSLPSKDITSIVVCDVVNETDCANIQTVTNPFNLPFTKVTITDSDQKVEQTLKSIATEMVYVTLKNK